jgi:regulator of protease activity HflC (stomatin/prohibitin superfamily)
VPAEIDGALFFMVTDAGLAVTGVQDFRFAITQYSQAALRDVVGALSLDELLSERERIQLRIGENVEAHIKEWGVHVDSIRLQDIEVPEDLKRMMSRQASAEREKRATITKSEGDRLAAQNLAAAANVMQANPGAMQLRTLQTIDGLGASPSNTIVLFPMELTSLAKRLSPKPEDGDAISPTSSPSA